MLETASPRLGERGGPHHGSPDKTPRRGSPPSRRPAGSQVPFTTGILIGIGETRAERIESLLAIARPAPAPRPHPGSHRAELPRQARQPAWRARAEPERRRYALDRGDGPDRARAADEHPGAAQSQPRTDRGSDRRRGSTTGAASRRSRPTTSIRKRRGPRSNSCGQRQPQRASTLTERLAVYPDYAQAPERWLDPALRTAVLRASDAEGFARATTTGRRGCRQRTVPPAHAGTVMQSIGRSDQCVSAARPDSGSSEGEIVTLFGARGGGFDAVCAAADALRRSVNGDTVSYVVNRNINYTNVCHYGCRFCAFSKGKLGDTLRGPAYDLDLDEIARRVREAWERGATEVCMQGGIHPRYTGETYLAFSTPPSARRAACTCMRSRRSRCSTARRASGLHVGDFLDRLRDAGLGTLPGTAAEILDDEVRAVLCPDKLTTAQWLDVDRGGAPARLAHHRDHHVRPCRAARALGAAPAAHPRPAGRAPAASPSSCRCRSCTWKRRSISKGRARKGPTFREAVLMHAVARLALHPLIPNIQASWVKLGPDGGRGLPRRRRQRSRRHADERKHLARRRHRARPGASAGADGRADRLARPRRRGSARRSIRTPPASRRAGGLSRPKLAPAARLANARAGAHRGGS